MGKLTLVLSMILLFGCSQAKETEFSESETSKPVLTKEPIVMDTTHEDSWRQYLSSKAANGDSIIIHVVVPLCDVDNQGVIGVTKRIADGLNPTTNLYWGAGYGIATHFKRSAKWSLISFSSNPNSAVLERLVFKHNSAKNTFLVADAYRGDSMTTCLNHFLQLLAGARRLSCEELDSNSIHPDLVVFNGHNGMMDADYTSPENQDTLREGAIVIACASEPYFKDYLAQYGSYPELLTTNLMAPEAYVLHGVLEDWLSFSSDVSLKKSAGLSYHNIQKCGLRGATNLFTEGW